MRIIQQAKYFVRRSPRLAAAGLVAFIGVSVGAYLLLKPEVEHKKDYRNVAVEVEEVRVGSLTRTITAVGTLMANQTVIIRPEINGIISKIHVEGGEFIEKGAPLFELDDRLFQAELKDAEAKLSFAKVEYNRAKQLADKNFGSAQKLDESRSKLLIAEAAVESAKAKLERAVITAPYEGVVGLHNLAIGAQVGPDKEIATLVDITPIKVDFKMPAEYLPFVSVGQRVQIKVDGFGDKKFTGLIAGIDSKVDPTAHSINIRALMPNKNNTFKPGLFARVDVIVGSKDNTLIIPEIAIETSGDQETVYKVVEGLAFQVPVLTGIREGENVEVLRGLNPGDHVVVVGQSKIRDGTPVRYELNGQSYSFNEADFKKKQQEMEEEKKQAEAPANEDEAGKAAESKEADKPVAQQPATAEEKVAEPGADKVKVDEVKPTDKPEGNKEALKEADKPAAQQPAVAGEKPAAEAETSKSAPNADNSNAVNK